MMTGAEMGILITAMGAIVTPIMLKLMEDRRQARDAVTAAKLRAEEAAVKLAQRAQERQWDREDAEAKALEARAHTSEVVAEQGIKQEALALKLATQGKAATDKLQKAVADTGKKAERAFSEANNLNEKLVAIGYTRPAEPEAIPTEANEKPT